MKALSVGILLAVGAVSAATASNQTSTLAGSVPGWAKSNKPQSAPDPQTAVGFRVYLGWTDPDAVVSLAKAVPNPHSSSYGQYLTPNQSRSRFAPSAADTAKVRNWLKSQGFDVTYIPQNNHYINVEGTVAQ